MEVERDEEEHPVDSVRLASSSFALIGLRHYSRIPSPRDFDCAKHSLVIESKILYSIQAEGIHTLHAALLLKHLQYLSFS